MKRRIFLSYKRLSDKSPGQDSEAQAEALRARLSNDYVVFMDKTIPPGGLWQGAISANLAKCDGAVALLSPAALTSDWVRHELSVLSNRQQTGDPPICFLVAMIGDAKVEALSEGAFKAMALDALQAYRPAPKTPGYVPAANEYDDEPALFSAIAQTFAQNLPPNYQSPQRRLVDRIVKLLESFPTSLDDLEMTLDTEDGASDRPARLTRVAEALVAAPPDWDRLTAVLKDLRRDPDATEANRATDKLTELLALTFHGWVDEGAAAALALARTGDKFPILAVKRDWTVQQYLRRAEVFPRNWSPLPLHHAGTERTVCEQVVEALCIRYLNEERQQRLAGRPAEEKLAQIRPGKVHRDVWFAFVSEVEQAEQLLGLNRLWIRPVLKGATNATPDKGVLLPPLKDAEEQENYDEYQDLVKAIATDPMRIVTL